MKKTIFFSAKTLVAVALTSLMFTSCEEESFTVNPAKPTELPNASATVSASTLNMLNSKELAATYSVQMPYVVAAGADGAIAAQNLEVTSTVEGYFTRTKTISIPAVAKGQSIYIPVVFYTSSLEDAISYTEPVFAEGYADVDAEEIEIAEFEAGKTNTIEFEIPQGAKLADYEGIVEMINNMTDVDLSRSASALADIKEAMLAAAKELAAFGSETVSVDLFIPEGTESIKVELTPYIKKGVMSFGAEVDGQSANLDNVAVEQVDYVAYAITFIDGEGHSHAGHAGHGGSNNAGGGSAGE